MIGRDRFLPAFSALVLLAGGLAAALRDGLTAPESGPAAAAVTRAADPPDPPPPVATEDRTTAWLATALARPLFDPRRRPTADVGAAVAPALPRLTGVVVSASGATAIFERPAGGKALALREGDRLDGYLVQSIVPGEAALLGPAGRLVLRPASVPTGQADLAASGTASGAAPGLGATRRRARPQGRRRVRAIHRSGGTDSGRRRSTDE